MYQLKVQNKIKKLNSVLLSLAMTAILLANLNGAAQNLSPAAGELDSTFDADGLVITPFAPNSNDQIFGMALQSDGKIVVAGGTRAAGTTFTKIAVARYNVNGSPDATFDADGKAEYSPTNNNHEARDVAVLPDGKILVATRSSASFGVLRLNANGSLDTSFSGGFTTANFGSGTTASANAITVLVDGKFFIVGILSGTASQIAVAKFNANGTPDTTFDTDGKLTTAITTIGDSAFDIAVQADGKIVVSGQAGFGGTNGDAAILRYNADGSLDSTFDTDGIVVTPITTSGFDRASAVVVLPDGKILAGIESNQTNTGRDIGLVRYNSNGLLDTTFGSGGIALYSAAATEELTDIIVQPDGKIISVGQSNAGSNAYDFAVWRSNANGSLDSSWGSGGVVMTNFNGFSNDFANAVVVQTDGKIVVAGQTGPTSGSSDFALARYNVTTVNRPPFDFDGDGKADLSVFRLSNGTWYISGSASGFSGIAFGASTDKIVPADYDGDGKTDVAVFRSGIWYLQRSQSGFTGVSFGAADDIPVPADYDADGKADLAVFRPGTGIWYLLQSANGFTGVAFGQAGDKPVPADYDGDGKTDVAVNRAGTWYIQRSQLGFTGIAFGDANDKSVPADYDGDGKADVAVFRPSNGTWYLQRSQLGFTGIAFGQTGDLPTPADYDGDGKADVAVFRNGSWYLNRSQTGFLGVAFGASDDLPAPNAFVR